MDNAYVAVIDGKGYSIGLVFHGHKGYIPIEPLGKFDSYEIAKEVARKRNAELGLSESFHKIIKQSGELNMPTTKNTIKIAGKLAIIPKRIKNIIRLKDIQTGMDNSKNVKVIDST